MERLTDKKEADAQRREYEIRLKQGYPRNIPEERFLRLAAYEDTGLEPEDLKRAFNEDDVLKLAGQALGITPERLRELVQADKEGRCVVLPKDGMVYYIEESGGEKWIGNKPIQQVVLRCGFGMALLEFSLFDKCKYFSRAEAEQALRREQDG